MTYIFHVFVTRNIIVSLYSWGLCMPLNARTQTAAHSISFSLFHYMSLHVSFAHSNFPVLSNFPSNKRDIFKTAQTKNTKDISKFVIKCLSVFRALCLLWGSFSKAQAKHSSFRVNCCFLEFQRFKSDEFHFWALCQPFDGNVLVLVMVMLVYCVCSVANRMTITLKMGKCNELANEYNRKYKQQMLR